MKSNLTINAVADTVNSFTLGQMYPEPTLNKFSIEITPNTSDNTKQYYHYNTGDKLIGWGGPGPVPNDVFSPGNGYPIKTVEPIKKFIDYNELSQVGFILPAQEKAINTLKDHFAKSFNYIPNINAVPFDTKKEFLLWLL